MTQQSIQSSQLLPQTVAVSVTSAHESRESLGDLLQTTLRSFICTPISQQPPFAGPARQQMLVVTVAVAQEEGITLNLSCNGQVPECILLQ
ncbi:hypothetical protein BaRGS_00007199 [Batillaria attramentaria]|uniref:Uncharacterized protein n=1 Tax=Batillaria attramentaria TaxID=370345 RepID=A0ABD0LRT7_9CAEN